MCPTAIAGGQPAVVHQPPELRAGGPRPGQEGKADRRVNAQEGAALVSPRFITSTIFVRSATGGDQLNLYYT